jgi:hypothetical protein
VRNVNLDARLNNGRSQHEDDEQHQHHVDKRSDVDVGERTLGASLGVGKCHVVKAKLRFKFQVSSFESS